MKKSDDDDDKKLFVMLSGHLHIGMGRKLM
jgi:hypothetical protein